MKALFCIHKAYYCNRSWLYCSNDVSLVSSYLFTAWCRAETCQGLRTGEFRCVLVSRQVNQTAVHKKFVFETHKKLCASSAALEGRIRHKDRKKTIMVWKNPRPVWFIINSSISVTEILTELIKAKFLHGIVGQLQVFRKHLPFKCTSFQEKLYFLFYFLSSWGNVIHNWLFKLKSLSITLCLSDYSRVKPWLWDTQVWEQP